jgi:hypothetical protein
MTVENETINMVFEPLAAKPAVYAGNGACSPGCRGLSQDNAVLPQDNAVLPQDNAALPQDNAALPQGNAVLPQDTEVLSSGYGGVAKPGFGKSFGVRRYVAQFQSADLSAHSKSRRCPPVFRRSLCG